MEEEENSEDFDEESIPICPCCLAPIEGDVFVVQFCGKCFAPIGGLAAINPFERIFAQGYIWRAAVTRPTKKVTLIAVGSAALFWIFNGIITILAGYFTLVDGVVPIIYILMGLLEIGAAFYVWKQVSANYKRFLSRQK